MQDPSRAASGDSAPVLCGIILHPAGHTLSPVLHQSAYAALGLEASYAVFDVVPQELEAAITSMRARGIRQLSVSIPHKEAVLKLADRVSEDARRIGAANTLTRVGDLIVADNTDWLGVLRTLETSGPWRGKRGCILGAGGAARGVVYALRKLEMEVRIVNRTRERAERLAHELDAEVGSLEQPYDLLVNATPLGMHPDVDSTPAPAELLREGATVFDTVYRPPETRLLREAAARGCRTQGGLDMLVHQAVEQIRIWSGQTPDPVLLRQTALEALAES